MKYAFVIIIIYRITSGCSLANEFYSPNEIFTDSNLTVKKSVLLNSFETLNWYYYNTGVTGNSIQFLSINDSTKKTINQNFSFFESNYIKDVIFKNDTIFITLHLNDYKIKKNIDWDFKVSIEDQ